MLIITKNGGFIADAQIEENVKGLCKKFFDEDDAQILGNVNTFSKNITRLPDRSAFLHKLFQNRNNKAFQGGYLLKNAW